MTFFPYGNLDASALAALRRQKDAGHTIGIHTAHHKNAAPFFAKKGGDLNVVFPAKELSSRRMVEGLGVGAHYKTDIEKVCALIRRLAKEDLALVIYSHDIAPEPSKIGMRTEWLGKILATAEENHVAVKGFGEL